MAQAMIESRGKKLEEKGQRISALESELDALRRDAADPMNRCAGRAGGEKAVAR